MKHLWEVEHPFYCAEENYLGESDYPNVSTTWADFVARGGLRYDKPTWDHERNLVFRWDWRDVASFPGPTQLVLFVMMQRHGHFRVYHLSVTKDDEPEVRAFLTRAWDTMRALWSPLALTFDRAEADVVADLCEERGLHGAAAKLRETT